MRRAFLAGGVYFAAVFALGFALGVVRVLALEPTLGAFVATLIEIPIILAAAWAICAAVTARFEVDGVWRARAAMGASALLLLIAAEFVLSVSSLGRSPVEQAGAWLSPAGLAGLAAQAAYAAFPLLQAKETKL